MTPLDPATMRRLSEDVVLADGTRIRIRPILPEDKDRLARAFDALSAESRVLRFFNNMPHLSPAMLTYFTEIDYVDHFAAAAIALDAPDQPGIGVARYIRVADDPESAEAAVVVADAYHGKGIGTLLLRVVTAVARENGIRHFVGHILRSNTTMITLARSLGARIEHDEGAMVRSITDVPDDDAAFEDAPLFQAFQRIARGRDR